MIGDIITRGTIASGPYAAEYSRPRPGPRARGVGVRAVDAAEHVGGLLADALYRVLPIGRWFGGR